MGRKILCLLVCLGFLFQQTGFAEVVPTLDIAGHLSQMRNNIIPDKFRPLQLRYFSYDNVNDSFKLLFDKGDLRNIEGAQFQESTRKLLSYFLIGISLPDKSFWVNLRPDSEDQIIDDELAKTDVGKILLEADLQLKKDTAKFTSPQTPEGKEYWDKLYKKSGELFGSENITIPTLTRPWIVPGEIIIRETEDSAFVYKATLKVMLEQDHLKDSAVYNFQDERLKELNEYSSQLIRELIIPKLTKEVNIAKRYAALRQVYSSLILSRWFKARFQDKGLSPKGTVPFYVSLIDSGNLNGLTSKESWSKTPYFEAYRKSFQQGEYNIKEPAYTPTGQVIRSYFSGGATFGKGEMVLRGYKVEEDDGLVLGSLTRRIGPLLEWQPQGDTLVFGLKPATAASPIGGGGYEPIGEEGDPILTYEMKDRLQHLEAYLPTAPEIVWNFGRFLSKRLIQLNYEQITPLNFIREIRKAIYDFQEGVDRDRYTHEYPDDSNLVKEPLLQYNDDSNLVMAWVPRIAEAVAPEAFAKYVRDELESRASSPLTSREEQEFNLYLEKGIITVATDKVGYYVNLSWPENSNPRYGPFYRSWKEPALRDARLAAIFSPLDFPLKRINFEDFGQLYKYLGALRKAQGAQPTFPAEDLIMIIEEIRNIEEPTEEDFARITGDSNTPAEGLKDTVRELLQKERGRASSSAQTEDPRASSPMGSSSPVETPPDEIIKTIAQNLQSIIMNRNQNPLEQFRTAMKAGNLTNAVYWAIANALGTEDRGPVEDFYNMYRHQLIDYLEGYIIPYLARWLIEDMPTRSPAQIQDEVRNNLREVNLSYTVYSIIARAIGTGDRPVVAAFYERYRRELIRQLDVQRVITKHPTYPDLLREYSEFLVTIGFSQEEIQMAIQGYKPISWQDVTNRFRSTHPDVGGAGADFAKLIVQFRRIEEHKAEFPDNDLNTHRGPRGASSPMAGNQLTPDEERDFSLYREKGIIAVPSEGRYDVRTNWRPDLPKHAVTIGEPYSNKKDALVAARKVFARNQLSSEELDDLKVYMEQRMIVSSGGSHRVITTWTPYGMSGETEIWKDFTDAKQSLEVARKIIARYSLKQVSPRIKDFKTLYAYLRALREVKGSRDIFSAKELIDIIERLRRQPQPVSDDDLIYVTRGQGTPVEGLREKVDELLKKGGGLASSPLEDTKDLGGIDFRVMNIITKPLVDFSGFNLTLPKLSNTEGVDLSEELKQIQKMIQAGIIPSGSRIKEFVAMCYQKGELKQRMDEVIACLVEICRLEEETLSESSPELKETLVICDSEKVIEKI